MKRNQFRPDCASRFRGLALTRGIGAFAVLVLACAIHGHAQEWPYFVTYSHDMEEPGNLEVAVKSAVGTPPAGSGFLGASTEFEYGAKAWWTTEFYLDGVAATQDSTIFTGFRWENRFRPLGGEHWINPVLYVEFEDINGADKSLLEVVGHDSVADFVNRNAISRQEKQRELEFKLILGRNYKGWNFSQNLIFEKNLNNSPWEFGYALGTSRPLKLLASSNKCAFCAQRFSAGVEMYGGLGDRYTPGLHDTSHYMGPSINWSSPSGITLSFSPQFGLNDNSISRLYRWGVSYEVTQVAQKMFSRRRGEPGGAK